MADVLASRIRELLGIGPDDLAGSFVAGEIPVADSVLNQLIARRLAASNAPVGEVQIEALDDDRLAIRVGLRGSRLLPAVTIAASIEEQPVFPGPGVLGLRWSIPGTGPFAMLAGPVLSLFKALPPGIHVEGERATIDIPEILRSRGLGELVRYIGGLRLHTRAGTVILGFEAGVAPPRPAAPEGSSHSPRPAPR